jgi:hypothetical protein
MKAVKNFVGGVLQPRVGLVQLASCLACQLAELVAIGYMIESPKNQIRTHRKSPCKKFKNCPAFYAALTGAEQESPLTRTSPYLLLIF